MCLSLKRNLTSERYEIIIYSPINFHSLLCVSVEDYFVTLVYQISWSHLKLEMNYIS